MYQALYVPLWRETIVWTPAGGHIANTGPFGASRATRDPSGDQDPRRTPVPVPVRGQAVGHGDACVVRGAGTRHSAAAPRTQTRTGAPRVQKKMASGGVGSLARAFFPGAGHLSHESCPRIQSGAPLPWARHTDSSHPPRGWGGESRDVLRRSATAPAHSARPDGCLPYLEVGLPRLGSEFRRRVDRHSYRVVAGVFRGACVSAAGGGARPARTPAPPCRDVASPPGARAMRPCFDSVRYKLHGGI